MANLQTRRNNIGGESFAYMRNDTEGTLGNIDASSAPHSYYIEAQEDNPMFITSVSVVCVGSTPFASDDYGDINGGLTNGISMQQSGPNITTIDFLDGFPIKTNYDWYHIGIMRYFDMNGGIRSSAMTWHPSTGVIRVQPGDRFEIILNDDLSSLTKHSFTVEGYKLQL